MSSYFDYVIEQPEAGIWKAAFKSTYADKEFINPYILKGAFWDTDLYSYDFKDLSPETLLMFTEKLGVYNQKEKEALKAKDVTVTILPPITAVSTDAYVKEEVLSVLRLLANNYQTKSRDTLVGVKLSGVAKYWGRFRGYVSYTDMSLNTHPVDEHTLENWIAAGKIANIVSIGNEYYWLCESPWHATINIRDYGILKDISDPSEVLTGSVTQYLYNKDGKELLQYQMKRSARMSTTEDIDDMILDIRKNIEELKKASSTENLVKVGIQAILEEKATEEDKATNLYKELLKFCEGADEYIDDDYREELGAQLNELIKLRAAMGTEGRLIWGIE